MIFNSCLLRGYQNTENLRLILKYPKNEIIKVRNKLKFYTNLNRFKNTVYSQGSLAQLVALLLFVQIPVGWLCAIYTERIKSYIKLVLEEYLC